MQQRINPSKIPVAIATIACALAAPSLHAVDYDFPGATPCNTTLQACVDALTSGDRINLQPGTVVNDTLDVRKSITLTAPASVNPPRIGSVGVLVTNADLEVTVQRLSIRGSIIARTAAGGGNLRLTVRDSIIDAANLPAVELSESTEPGNLGSRSVTIAGNAIRAALSLGSCEDGVRVSVWRSPTVMTVTDNRIAMMPGDCAGISAYRVNAANLDFSVERNEVRGTGFGGGVRLRDGGADAGPVGRLTASVFSNIVSGQYGDAGFPGAIIASAEGSGARLSAQIINNTVTGCRDGIAVSGRDDFNARVEGRIANNIVAGCERYGIGIAAPAVSNSHNLLFDNGVNLFEPGPGTRYGDPKFADLARGDLRLTTGSDAVDVGDESALPAQQQRDVYGQLRRVGFIDIGAAEAGFLRPAEPVPALAAPAWLMALAMLLALAVAAVPWASRRSADLRATGARASCTSGTRPAASRCARRAH